MERNPEVFAQKHDTLITDLLREIMRLQKCEMEAEKDSIERAHFNFLVNYLKLHTMAFASPDGLEILSEHLLAMSEALKPNALHAAMIMTIVSNKAGITDEVLRVQAEYDTYFKQS